MIYKSHNFLALAALLALASENASAFTPSTLSSERRAFSPLFAAAVENDVSIDYDSAAKLAYDEWRNLNSKGNFDDAKFEAFKANYVALTVANVKASKKAREDGAEIAQKLELNEFADMTVAEFQSMQGDTASAVEEPSVPEDVEDSDVSIVYDSAARVAYDAWRANFNQGEFVETKFQVFKENYEIVAVANVSAKKAARESGSEAVLIDLGDDADAVIVEIEKSAPVNPLQTAMDALAAQEAASGAIGEAAAALAEEEEKLAQKLGLESVEELEAALDAMDGIADDGGELDPTNISREARVRAAYLEWCKENGKETDESRFPTFSSNFLAMEAYANDNDKTMQLNKYADFSEEEYAALTSGKSVETEIEVVAEAEEEAAETKKAAEAKKAEVEAEKAADQAAIKKAAEAKKAEEEAKAAEAKKTEEEAKAAEAKKAEEAKAAAAAAKKAREEEAKNKTKEIEKEKQARQAAQEKALAKAAAEAEAVAIAAAKETAEREAAQIARRRELDAQAADKERQKAKKIAAVITPSAPKAPAPTPKPSAPVVEKKVKPPVAVKAEEKKPAAPSVFGNFFGGTKKADGGAAKAAAVKKDEAAAKAKDEAAAKAKDEASAKAEAVAKAKAEAEAAVKKAEAEAAAKKADAEAAAKKAEAEAAGKAKIAAAKKAEAAGKAKIAAKEKESAPMFGNFFAAPKPITPAPKVSTSTPSPPSKPDVEIADPVSDAFASIFGSKPVTPKKVPEPVPTPAPVAKKPEPFSFFGGAKPAASKKAEPAPAPAPAPVAKKPEPFSFFGGAKPAAAKKTAPVPAPTPKPAPKPSFFGGSKPAPKSVPAPTPAPVAKKPEPFSFFSKPAPTPVPAPAPVAKKPEPFSFFSKPAPAPAPVPAPAPKQKFSVFGGATKPAPKPAPAPEPVAKKVGTFNLFNFGGKVKKTDVSAVQKTTPAKKPMPVMRRGTISLGSPAKKPMPVMRRGTISLGSPAAKKTRSVAKPAAGNKFGGVAKAAGGAASKNDGIPVLSNWKQESDGSVSGNISNSKVFRKGQKITTSPVRRGAKANTVVTTSSGSKYRLS